MTEAEHNSVDAFVKKNVVWLEGVMQSLLRSRYRWMSQRGVLDSVQEIVSFCLEEVGVIMEAGYLQHITKSHVTA